jgi:single-stranded-DNA-specific exonuclease
MTTWIDPQPVEVPESIRQLVSASGELDALVAELLVRRGITDPDVARGFLDPAAYTPASPDALPDLALAVERLVRAIQRGERIAIWGDFDVDGQTATALYLEALRDLGTNVTFRIPTRRQSHGVHPVGVQRLIDRGVQLLLTADTGIAAREAIALAVSRGVDVLVTDHHDLPSALPNALAMVNPKRLPAEHPLYELPGVGVAYQVVHALYERLGRSVADHTLDLVALGIVADVATLRADVRYLLQRGLHVLRDTGRLGLQAMMSLAGLVPSRLTEEDIGFTLAPRLNALSRVGEELGTEAGVELLTTADLVRARTIATALEALNARRRWLTRQTFDAALEQLDRDRTLLDGPAVVVAGANWDPGIVGIVAGRLTERFNKPAIVLSAPPGEMARGSARSVEGVDIHAAIAAQQQMLYRCGGHPMAAGLSLEGERIPEFRRALWRTLARTAPPAREKEIQIDAYLTMDQLSLDLVRAVGHLAPFGPGNERPVFATVGLGLASSAIIGRTREHRRAVVRNAQGREQTVMWWRSADQPPPEGTFDLAYTIGINAFRGEESVQLTWVDARLFASVAVEVVSKSAIVVQDYRGLMEAAPVLRSLLLSEGGDRTAQPLVWGEGVLPRDVPMSDRNALHETETLIVWTVPPGPAEFSAALETTLPRRVVLFGVDPDLDTPRNFLRRLAGLVKYALRERDGRLSLSQLAAAIAHSRSTVRLGLEWMALKGQVEVTWHKGDQVELRLGQADLSCEQDDDRLPLLQARLLARLEETAAYRAYFGHANAERLINV